MSCDPIKPSTSEDALVHVSPVLLGIKNQDEIPICGGADSTEYYWCLASQQSTSHHLVLTLSLQLLSPLSLSASSCGVWLVVLVHCYIGMEVGE